MERRWSFIFPTRRGLESSESELPLGPPETALSALAKNSGVPFGVDPSYWGLQSEKVRLISCGIIFAEFQARPI